MKIGILTFHKSKNYGSVLQTYALLMHLKSELHEVEIIDYVPKTQKETYSIFRKTEGMKSIFFNMLSAFDYSFLRKKSDAFERFFEKYSLSIEIKDVKRIEQFDYDAVISGSDQIWNVGINDFNDIYMIPFVCKKKISYAVSMGKVAEVEKKVTEHYLEYIDEFNYLSTRERKTQEMLMKLLGRDDIECVLDPTFLLSAEKWRELAGKEAIKKEEYILVYSIEYYKDIVEVIRDITNKYKKKVVYIYTCKKSFWCALGGWERNKKCSPQDFLNYVLYADFVISSSFHGCAFSLIFEKQFLAIERFVDNQVIYEDRIRTLLEQLSLENHIINGTMEIKNMDYEEIDYIRVNKILRSRIKESKKYLRIALEE